MAGLMDFAYVGTLVGDIKPEFHSMHRTTEWRQYNNFFKEGNLNQKQMNPMFDAFPSGIYGSDTATLRISARWNIQNTKGAKTVFLRVEHTTWTKR